tara:strand:- start:652 stop:1542 length:891 start_codon:yes stop_codon:yes gene_type:complete
VNIHENREERYRSESLCGYCRQKGHNQYQCTKVKHDWEFFKNFQIPNDGRGNILSSGWYRYSREWGSWYEHCKKTHAVIAEREEAAKSTTPLQGRPKAKRACGFCREEGHTRSKCETMKAFIEDCHTANIKWRKAAYQEIVVEKGISIGSAVVVRNYSDRWNSNEFNDYSGIITSINWDTLNVFTALPKHHDDAWSPIRIGVLLTDGKTRTITKEIHNKFNCVGKGGRASRWGHHENVELIKVVAPAKQLLSKEWINGYKGAFDTLTKKRTLEQLQNGALSAFNQPDLLEHIQVWK